MGGSRFVVQIIWHYCHFILSPAFAGLKTFILRPGAYAPGFMLRPAPQAKRDSLQNQITEFNAL